MDLFHDHDAEHEHSHPHPAPGVGEVPFVDNGPLEGPPEALMLNIGGDIGALMVFAEEECLGLEIDLSPIGMPQSHHTHTMIRRRRAIDRDFIVGVYPELREGSYTVWGLDGKPLGEVSIGGGAVAEFQAGRCRSD